MHGLKHVKSIFHYAYWGRTFFCSPENYVRPHSRHNMLKKAVISDWERLFASRLGWQLVNDVSGHRLHRVTSQKRKGCNYTAYAA